jgi:hypothetical protein
VNYKVRVSVNTGLEKYLCFVAVNCSVSDDLCRIKWSLILSTVRHP